MYDIVCYVQELEVVNLDDKRLSDKEMWPSFTEKKQIDHFLNIKEDAAQQLCLQNLGLIRKRQLLIDTADENNCSL